MTFQITELGVPDSDIPVDIDPAICAKQQPQASSIFNHKKSEAKLEDKVIALYMHFLGQCIFKRQTLLLQRLIPFAKRGRFVTSKKYRSKAAPKEFGGDALNLGIQRSIDFSSGYTYDSKAALKS